MKLKSISAIFAAGFLLGLASCSKNEPSTPAAEAPNNAAVSAADLAGKSAETAKAEAAKIAQVVKAEAAKVVQDATTEAARVAETAQVEAAKVAEAAGKAANNDKAAGLIEKLKNLIAEGNYSEATTVLQQLAGQSLSADQTTLVDGLKQKIQKALAAKAAQNTAGGVGNLLKK